MTDTPKANRIHIAFFGNRNAGKSTLVNRFTGQEVAIVSPTAGTTTDPVSKAMEILPLGPCLITDTAGLDDEGELGRQRVEKSLAVLATTDIAVWVGEAEGEQYAAFRKECEKREITVFEYRRGDDVEELKERISKVKVANAKPVLDGIIRAGMKVLLICPQDGSAPKGRLILPQQQVIREILDAGAVATICQPEMLAQMDPGQFELAITDSQAFGKVAGRLPETVKLTSFSVLFARAKGDLAAFGRGLAAIAQLKDGDRVLIAEGCTHKRQCGDIGREKIPAAIRKLCGKKIEFVFANGNDFPKPADEIALAVHCGGCMLTRREMLRRIEAAEKAGKPITNYGLVLAAANGVKVEMP